MIIKIDTKLIQEEMTMCSDELGITFKILLDQIDLFNQKAQCIPNAESKDEKIDLPMEFAILEELFENITEKTSTIKGLFYREVDNTLDKIYREICSYKANKFHQHMTKKPSINPASLFYGESLSKRKEINNSLTCFEINKLDPEIQQHALLLPAEIIQPTSSTVLYPCSAADVCYPLNVFPNAQRFVLIDSNNFMSKKLSAKNKDFNPLVNLSLCKKFKTYFKKNLHSIGPFGLGSGYDITGAHRNGCNELFASQDEETGVSTLLLYRLRVALGLRILSISQVEELSIHKVLAITPSGSVKEIIFVQHYFGTESLEYDWLIKQNFNFDGLLLKAYVPALFNTIDFLKTEINQIFSILGSKNFANGFPVVADKSSQYNFTDLPPFFKYIRDGFVVNATFGYDKEAFVTTSLNLLGYDLDLEKKVINDISPHPVLRNNLSSRP